MGTIDRTVNEIIAVTYIATFAVMGYHHRKEFWTRRSWVRFSALITLNVLLIAVGFLMAEGVDNGFKKTLPPWSWDIYSWTAIVFAVLAPAGLIGLLAWFAHGRPDRQVQFTRQRKLQEIE